MVTIIVPHVSGRQGVERNGGLVPSFRPSPLLETPDALPQSIQVEGLQRKRSYIESSYDPHLTELLHTTLGSDTYSVEYVVGQDGNFPIIDTFNSECKYAIGARCEMLENQYGIGSLIMYLLDNAPLWIMTPMDIQRDLAYYLHAFSDIHRDKEVNMYPDWVNPCNDDIPKGLPKRLDWILRSCKDCILDNMYAPDAYDDVGRWPFAVCSWYGFEPMVDKRMRRITLNNHDFGCGSQNRMRELESRDADQGQASDPSWFVLDHMIPAVQEYSHTSCMPLCHELDTAETVIGNFYPFLELLNYISHDKIT